MVKLTISTVIQVRALAVISQGVVAQLLLDDIVVLSPDWNGFVFGKACLAGLSDEFAPGGLATKDGPCRQ